MFWAGNMLPPQELYRFALNRKSEVKIFEEEITPDIEFFWMIVVNCLF